MKKGKLKEHLFYIDIEEAKRRDSVLTQAELDSIVCVWRERGQYCSMDEDTGEWTEDRSDCPIKDELVMPCGELPCGGKIVEAYGLLITREGSRIDLDGDTFWILPKRKSKGSPTEFPIHELPKHLFNYKVVSIGEQEIGDEANVVIELEGEELKVFGTAEEVNYFFNL